MSALMAPRRPRRRARPEGTQQASLFGAGAPAPAPPVPAPRAPEAPAAEPTTRAPEAPAAEPATTVRAHRQGPTLDDLVAGVWEGLLAGAPTDCPACGTVMSPRHSAGAGIVGGRCGGCGSSLS
jgi:hypothetical protein